MFSMRPARAAPTPGSPVTGAATADFAPCDLRVDDFVERYVEWREKCQTLDSAYRQWARSNRSERDLAFATYRAALDREEQAAAVFRMVAECLERSGWRVASPARPRWSIG